MKKILNNVENFTLPAFAAISLAIALIILEHDGYTFTKHGGLIFGLLGFTIIDYMLDSIKKRLDKIEKALKGEQEKDEAN